MARILVVDDNEENRYLLEVLLKGGGHEVISAKNGVEGMEAAIATPPDLVVSDILMPGMDGFAFCLEWKKNPRLRGVPFIIYTATYTERKDEELAYRLGADRFVIKPQDPEVLIGIIQEGLAGSFGRPPGPCPAARGEEGVVFKEYSEALFRKLEQKVADLETAKRALEKTIEDRTRAEESLKESEAKYRIVADNTYNWEFWIDPRGSFIYSSPACLRLTGHPREEFLADPGLLERLVHPDDLGRFRDHRAKAFSGKGCVEIEFRLLHRDGSVRWIAQDCAPVAGEDGRFLGLRGSNRDVTERKRLEELLRHAQRLEAVGLLAGGIAGEFNKLMAAIIGSVDHIPVKVREHDPLRESMDQVLAATARASSLTRDLLSFSRKQEMRFAPLDLNDLLRGNETPVRRVLGEKVRMQLALGEGPLRIMADRAQMEQALINLVANAREAMPGGGRVVISTGTLLADEEFTQRHGVGSPGRYAFVSIADEGVGMSDEVLQRVFEPFFTTKGEGYGTGLGLSVAHGIVGQHGGFILVESALGKGSTFKVALPLLGPDKKEER